MQSPGTLEAVTESADIAAEWYLVPKPTPPSGWLVFSEDFVLRVLQNLRESTDPPSRTPGWRLYCGLTMFVIGLLQALVMGLAYVPLVRTLMEPIIVYWKRGGFGFFLRSAYWKTRLKALGQNTLIDRGVEIWGAGNIEIGSWCHVDTQVRLAAGEEGFGQHGGIVIGNYTHVGPRCHIAGRGQVLIGDLVSLQAGVHIYSASNSIMDPAEPGKLLSFSHTAPLDLQHTVEGPVVIEDYSSVGYSSIILPGVTLGTGCVVHPFSQVSRSFPAFANIVGPGRARQNGWRRPLRPDPRRQNPPEGGAPAPQ